MADGLMRARPALQKAFWFALAFGCVYFAFHTPAKPPAPPARTVPASQWIYPWPPVWEC